MGIRQAMTITDGPVGSKVGTFGLDTVTGNAILAFMRAADAGGDPMVTGSVAGNSNDGSYTPGPSTQFSLSNAQRLSVFYFPNITGRAGHIVTLTPGATAYITGRVYELDNVPASSIVTGTALAGFGTGTAVASGAVTPADLGTHFGACSYGHGSGSTTITLNWGVGATQEIEIDEQDAANGPLNVATKAAVIGVAENAAWTLNESVGWAAINIAIKFGSGGGGGGRTTKNAHPYPLGMRLGVLRSY